MFEATSLSGATATQAVLPTEVPGRSGFPPQCSRARWGEYWEERTVPCSTA